MLSTTARYATRLSIKISIKLFDELCFERAGPKLKSRRSPQQFVKRPFAELAPDPNDTKQVQSRVWGTNCVQELQARIDATREMHEARTKK
jgi:hypothetical protein